MAEADYNLADRVVLDSEGNPVANGYLTANEKVQTTVQATPDADAAQFAADAGVQKPEYANYATALDAYAARADIEGLAERRAREYGESFGAADFMRDAAYNADGTAAAAPRPGTIYGDAPDAAGVFDAADSNVEDAAVGDNPVGS